MQLDLTGVDYHPALNLGLHGLMTETTAGADDRVGKRYQQAASYRQHGLPSTVPALRTPVGNVRFVRLLQG